MREHEEEVEAEVPLGFKDWELGWMCLYIPVIPALWS